MLTNEKKIALSALVASAFAFGGCGDAGSGTPEKEVGSAESPRSIEQADTTAPAPEDVYIDPNEDIAAAGTGCPSGVAQKISPDRKSFVVSFPDMVLYYPEDPENPGHRLPLRQSKNCSASMNIHVPQGWQFSLATINTHVTALLSDKVRARETSNYFFAGVPHGSFAHSTLVGPFDDDGFEKPVVFTDYVGIASVVWSPCGATRPFTIDTSIALNAAPGGPGAYATFNATSVDGIFEKKFSWSWRRCTR